MARERLDADEIIELAREIGGGTGLEWIVAVTDGDSKIVKEVATRLNEMGQSLLPLDFLPTEEEIRVIDRELERRVEERGLVEPEGFLAELEK